MTTQFTENNKYLLEFSLFNRSILICTWVTYTTAYFKLADSKDENVGADYRLDIKSKKLHKFNHSFQSWDLMEGYTFTEYGTVMS